MDKKVNRERESESERERGNETIEKETLMQ